MVLGSEEVVRRLARLHASSCRGWSENVGARLSGGAGLVLLAVAVVPMLLVSGKVAISQLADAPGSPLTWAVAAAGAAMATLIGREGMCLVRGRRPSESRLSRLLLLSTVAPALGLLALALGVHSATFGVSPAESFSAELVESVGRDAALLAAGLLLGIAGALSWFGLRSRASVLAEREVDALLDDGRAAEHRPPGGVTPLARRRRA
jgi:hypothetical protein